MPLAFFFGLVALDPFDEVLAPFLAPFLASFGAALDPFRDGALGLFGAALGPFGASSDPFVLVDFDPFAVASFSSAALLAKSSCLLEQPVASKIRLMVGEVSSSMVARDNGGACDDVMEKAVRTFFLVTYGLPAVLRRRRGGAVPSFSLLL